MIDTTFNRYLNQFSVPFKRSQVYFETFLVSCHFKLHLISLNRIEKGVEIQTVRSFQNYSSVRKIHVDDIEEFEDVN